MSALKAIVQKEFDQCGNVTTKEDAFKYYSELYFEYVSISQTVNDCYDTLIHPQKRQDIRNLFIFILCRIIDLRHCLVSWNTGVSNLEGKKNVDPIPWEYLDLHKCLSNLNKRPIDIKIPIPSFLKENDNQQKQERDTLVEGYMQLKHSLSSIPLEDHPLIDKEDWVGQEEEGSHDVEIGPEAQGISVYDTSLQESCVRRKKSAIVIQKYARGYIVRCTMKRSNEAENRFVGLITEDEQKNSRYILKDRVKDMILKRKVGQQEVDDEYNEVLVTLDNLLRRQEFFDMKQALMKERVQWVTEQISQTNEIPGDLEIFYKMKNALSLTEKDDDDAENAESNTGVLPNTSAIHLIKPTKMLQLMMKNVAKYEDTWNCATEETHVPSKYDEDVAKNVTVRHKVYNEARKHVDDLLVTNLQRLKVIQSPKGSGTKGADKKKKKGKSGKKSKSKKGKSKALPGEKLSGLKSMDTAHMLSILIENKLVNNVDDLHIDDLVASDLPVIYDCNDKELEV